VKALVPDTVPYAPVRSALAREVGEDGVLTVTIDVPGERMNTLGKAMMGELDALLGELEAPGAVQAVVLHSGKPDNFIAGADIKDFKTIRSAMEGEALSRAAQALLDRLEIVPVPVVAAIHGACLGGGLEIALACRYRVASDDPKTVVGLPEVMLGLLPGAGGTQRLPRLVGLRAGLDMILTGRTLKAARALEAGVVDGGAAPVLLAAARGPPFRWRTARSNPARGGISATSGCCAGLFRKARQSVLEKTGGHYPAPLRAGRRPTRYGAVPGRGLKVEARHFGELAVSDVSRALVSRLLRHQDIKKDAGYPEGTQAAVRKLGVLGAGLMGAGIATAAADAGRARPHQRTRPAPRPWAAGLRHARGSDERRKQRKSLSALEVRSAWTGCRRPSTTAASGAPTCWRPSSRTSAREAQGWRRPRP
jgi:3-hydroxyacyl-CoA dehydrogenase/enoyl-CoA hydratase/3-hydroxybutyryl-CoA epimerase